MEKEAGETDRQTEETLKVRDEEEKLKDLGRERLRGTEWAGHKSEKLSKAWVLQLSQTTLCRTEIVNLPSNS